VRKLRNSIVADSHLNVDMIKYIKHWLIMINRTLIIFACIAYFALSSKRIYIRLLINRISLTVCFIFSIHIPFNLDVVSNPTQMIIFIFRRITSTVTTIKQ